MQFRFEMGLNGGQTKITASAKRPHRMEILNERIYASEAGTEVQLFIIEGVWRT